MAINNDEVKRRLKVLLNDAHLVNEYVRQFGPLIEMKNIKALKENQTLDGSKPATSEEDPVFEVEARCPVCNKEEIIGYELYAKSQQILPNKFLVPTYLGAQRYFSVDYTLLAVTVCPSCLFASPDRKDFNRKTVVGVGDAKSQIPGNVLLALLEQTGERKALLENVTDYENHFSRPRFEDAAIDSYRLVMARARVELRYEQPYALFKLGAAALRIAKIMKDSHRDNLELLREALGILRMLSENPTAFRRDRDAGHLFGSSAFIKIRRSQKSQFIHRRLQQFPCGAPGRDAH